MTTDVHKLMKSLEQAFRKIDCCRRDGDCLNITFTVRAIPFGRKLLGLCEQQDALVDDLAGSALPEVKSSIYKILSAHVSHSTELKVPLDAVWRKFEERFGYHLSGAPFDGDRRYGHLRQHASQILGCSADEAMVTDLTTTSWENYDKLRAALLPICDTPYVTIHEVLSDELFKPREIAVSVEGTEMLRLLS